TRGPVPGHPEGRSRTCSRRRGGVQGLDRNKLDRDHRRRSSMRKVGRGIQPLLLLFFASFVAPELEITLERSRRWSSDSRSGLRPKRTRLYARESQLTPAWEAAEHWRCGGRLSLRRIIIPQSIRIMIPPYMANALTLLKQTQSPLSSRLRRSP